MKMPDVFKRLQLCRTDCLFLILASILFAKLVFFAWSAYGMIYISSFVTNHAAFWGWYIPKIAAAIWLASIVYLIRDKRWWVIGPVILDIWIIANLLYLRSYDMPLDAYAVSMFGNMDGFWSSILPLFNWSDILYPLLTIACFVIAHILNEKYRSWGKMIAFFAFATILNTGGKYLFMRSMYGHEWASEYTRFQCFTMQNRIDVYGNGNSRVLRETSPLHTFWYSAFDLIVIQADKGSYQLTETEKMAYAPLFSKDMTKSDMCLVMIIVESFDSWVLTEEYMPYLYTFINNHPCFYADKMKSQVRGGMSADGQMIINTGLLPVTEGAACYRFPYNEFPGIMKSINGKSQCILPHKKDVWNQGQMSLSYGYTETIELNEDDSVLFRAVVKAIREGYQGVQMITLSTHTPYHSVCNRSHLELPASYDEITQNYIRSFNYFDSQLKNFLDVIDTDSILRQSTIMITGDHAAPYPIKKAYCPFIIYSPNISLSIKYTEECYQMDIYPTIMSVIGATGEWHGGGLNLIDPSKNRLFTEEEMYEMSDKLIRANYFSTPIEKRICPNCQ